MKKFLVLMCAVLFFQTILFAEDFAQTEEKTTEKDPATFNEKFRKTLHLPPPKHLYYHNIDKSNQPVFMEDYYKLAAEKKRKDFVIPEPDFTREDDIIMPEHQFRVVKYNIPPGQRNIDESGLILNGSAVSSGILSPDKTKMVYTKSFFYREFAQTAAAAYYIPVRKSLTSPYEALLNTNITEGSPEPIVTSGMDSILERRFVSLFPIDWSADSNKIAFKEKIGSNFEGTWQTNIIIYDFKTKQWKRLNAVREAIIYWWRQNKDIDLKDYLWDIFPVGWDKKNPERLIVYAYAFTADKPLFLGTWSIDFNEAKSKLISINSTSAQIDLNGFGLKEIKDEH
ncbi:MAG: hypothetical protein LUG16_02395 [Candidatus Gastranaerophilales bacterium]|nr:hypothetical protein [Candidatus Gastranaerophilales bacterium]